MTSVINLATGGRILRVRHGHETGSELQRWLDQNAEGPRPGALLMHHLAQDYAARSDQDAVGQLTRGLRPQYVRALTLDRPVPPRPEVSDLTDPTEDHPAVLSSGGLGVAPRRGTPNDRGPDRWGVRVSLSDGCAEAHGAEGGR